MELLQTLANASPGAQALAGAAGALSPAALAFLLLVVLPRWERALKRAVRVLGMLGALAAGFVIVRHWDQISTALGV